MLGAGLPSLLLRLLLPALAAIAIQARAAEPAQLTTADLENWLDGFLPYALAEGDIAGAVVVIVRDGEILLSKGYGYADLDTQEPVDPARTLFRPGSISKLFTWTATMQLVEQGALELDEDINTYLDFEIPEAFGAPITVRHLMTHTPGFEEVFKNLINDDPESFIPLEDYIKAHVPDRVFPPGTVPAYSNYGTALMGYIVARVSGLSFDDYIARHILEPLGMTRSTFRQPLPEHLASEMSAGYARASDGKAKPFELVIPAPAGALSATGEDMARFMIAHLDGGGAILSLRTARLMHASANRPIPPLNGMALGFYEQSRNGRRIISHGGDTGFFHSNLHLFLDESVGLFISMNSSGAGGATGKIRDSLLREFTDRYFPAPVTEPPTPEGSRERARVLAGTYDSSRASWSSFGRMVSLMGQMSIEAMPNGDLLTPGVTDTAGAPKRWREIEPYVWREVGGQNRLTARLENGSVDLLGIEWFAPIITFLPAPWWRNWSVLQVVLIGATAVIGLAALMWPVRAAVRRYYRRKHGVALAAYSYTHRLAQMGTTLVLTYLIAWGAFLAWVVSSLTSLDGSADPILLMLHVAGIIPLAALAVATWDAVRSWREGRKWWVQAWNGLIVLAIACVIWFSMVGGLYDVTLSY